MKIKVVCFGEVLWDVFPDNERIGGAPLNVASRLSALGIETSLISQVGTDQKGEDIISYLKNKKVKTNNITVQSSYPTGTVNVSLNKSGSATYEIAYPSAWDKIEFSESSKEAVQHADVFIFGSLVCRDEISRSTLLELLKFARYKVFDINLRPPHYEKGVLQELMKAANFIKFNDEELYEIAKLFGSKFNSLEQNMYFIAETFHSETICVTKGSHGAVLFHKGKLYCHSGYKIKVKDTVGAGDSFLAGLTAKILQQEEPYSALNYACAMGAMVAGSDGANPEIGEQEIKNFMFPE